MTTANEFTRPCPPDRISVEDLHAHSVAEGECLRWVGCKNIHGQPRFKSRSVRRMTYESIHGPLSPKFIVTTRCSTDCCVAPNCLVARSKSRMQKGIPKRLDHARKIAVGRRKGSAMTMELAREIRASAEKPQQIADRLGLPRHRIYNIRANRSWVDHGSPFAGLGAR